MNLTQELGMAHNTKLTAQRHKPTAALLLLGMLLLAACGGSAPSPYTTPTATQATIVAPPPLPEDTESALPMLIMQERNGAAAGDFALLATLWAEDGVLVERREGGDYTFSGRAAILDRYEVAVSQHPPEPMDSPPDVTVTADGDKATIVNGIDRWHFVRDNGRWWIALLEIAH